MARRMNYGPRFRSGAVGVGYHYDKRMHKGLVNPKFLGMTAEQRMWAAAKGHACTKESRAAVKMPTFSWDEKGKMSEREAAERRVLEQIQQCVKMLDFSVEELTHIPNPSKKYKNLLDQLQVIEALRRLCNCVYPPIKLARFEEGAHGQQRRTPVPMSEMPECVSCGGPARIEKRGEWFCEDCAVA